MVTVNTKQHGIKTKWIFAKTVSQSKRRAEYSVIVQISAKKARIKLRERSRRQKLTALLKCEKQFFLL